MVHTVLLFAGAVVVFALLALDARAAAVSHAEQESTHLAVTIAAEPLVTEVVASAHAAAGSDRDGSVAAA